MIALPNLGQPGLTFWLSNNKLGCPQKCSKITMTILFYFTYLGVLKLQCSLIAVDAIVVHNVTQGESKYGPRAYSPDNLPN